MQHQRQLLLQGLRQCCKCHTVKPITDFYTNGDHDYHYQCKECTKERVRAYFKRKWREDAEFREKRTTYMRSLYKTNATYREKCCKKARARSSINQEHRKKRLTEDKVFLVQHRKYMREYMNGGYARERHQHFKKELVDAFGGKCQRCGYNRCLRALDFHHINQADKDDGFSIKIKATRDKLIQQGKAGKVLLLCANCHREAHDET